MNEQWKDIQGYPGYQISSFGNVRSLTRTIKRTNGFMTVTGKQLNLMDNGVGYKFISFGQGKNRICLYAHRLVAMHFLPMIDGKDQVNHKNGKPADNRVENLEWCTRSENMQHAYATGLAHQYERSGTKNPAARIVLDMATGIFYDTMKEAAELYNLSVSYLSQMLTGTKPNKTNLQYV